MPKILRIINRLNLGGPTYNAAYLTRHLAPEFETLMLAGTRQASEESSEYIVEGLGLPVRYIPAMHRELNFRRDFAAYRQIRKVIREFKPDIVHTHAAKAGALGRLAAIACGVSVVVHTFHGHVFHSYFSKAKTRMFLGIERYLASRSSAIIALSGIQKMELCQQFRICDTGKCHVIPLGFDLARFSENMDDKRKAFRKLHHIAGDETAIGIIGRLTAIKDHRFFLDAFWEVQQKAGKKLKAVIVGDGEELDNLKSHCETLGLTYALPDQTDPRADVIFTSWIMDVDRAVAGMDIVAMSSRNEGTPVSLIEAQAGGRAVVSTAAGGTADVVAHGTTGLLSEVGDKVAFCANLLKLVTDEGLRKTLAMAGKPFATERFHYDRLVEDMRHLYHNLLIAR